MILTTVLITIIIKEFRKLPESYNKHQASIIRSITIQVIISLIFFIIPILTLFVTWRFRLSHTFTLVMISICGLCLHPAIEMLSLLYFILPYRLFIKKHIYSFFKITPKINSNNNVNPSTIVTGSQLPN